MVFSQESRIELHTHKVSFWEVAIVHYSPSRGMMARPRYLAVYLFRGHENEWRPREDDSRGATQNVVDTLYAKEMIGR
jgi:hypothetical protein